MAKDLLRRLPIALLAVFAAGVLALPRCGLSEQDAPDALDRSAPVGEPGIAALQPLPSVASDAHEAQPAQSSPLPRGVFEKPEPEPVLGKLRGHVVWDRGDAPRVELRIEAVSASDRRWIEAGFTDGPFDIDLPVGSWRVRALAWGMGSSWVAVHVGAEPRAGDGLRLTLRRGDEVSGLAVDRDEVVQAKFAVTLQPVHPDGQPSGDPIVVWSDSSGRFTAAASRGSSWLLHAGLPAQPAGPILRTEASDPFEGARVTVRVDAVGELAVTFLPAIEGSMVGTLAILRTAESPDMEWTAILDSAGCVRFPGLPPGDYRIDAHTGCGIAEARPVRVEAGRTSARVQLMLRGGPIRR